MGTAFEYKRTPAANNEAPPNGFPEGWDGDDVNESLRELAARLMLFLWAADWLDLFEDTGIYTVSKLTDTSFRIATSPAEDLTAYFPVNRRLRISDGTTTVFGYVVSASFSTPNNDITVDLDSGVVPTAVNSIQPHLLALAQRSTFESIGSDKPLSTGLHTIGIPGTAIVPQPTNGCTTPQIAETTAQRPSLKGPIFPDAIAATGTILFQDNPSNTESITLNGSTWTFVTSGATGNQTNIGGSLAATLTQLVSDLNGSGDANIDDATYGETLGTTLTITHDTPGVGGNSYTLGDDGTIDVTRSGDNLTGGSDSTYGEFDIPMPKSWDGGDIQVQLGLVTQGGHTPASDDVIFAAAARYSGDGDSLDQAFGTEVNFASTELATGEVLELTDTITVTPGGSVDASRAGILTIRIARHPLNGSDSLDIGCWLQSLKVFYTVEARNDA